MTSTPQAIMANEELTTFEVRELNDVANKLRISTLQATTESKGGSATSCASIAEILAVLFYKIMRFVVKKPKDPANDRLVLSKGHAAPILYAAWAEVGLFPKEKLLSFRQIYSDLEGHPTPRLNFIDAATGSLGQGLSIAAGMAYAAKKILHLKYRVFCIIGDSESCEGSIWEGCNFAGFHKLDNLCVIIDVNRFGQTGPTILGHDLNAYAKRFASFGFYTVIVDGHNIDELFRGFRTAETSRGKPTIIIAKTLKGKNFVNFEDANNYHGKCLGDNPQKIKDYLENLIINKGQTSLKVQEPTWALNYHSTPTLLQLSTPPDYVKDDLVSTREAYGGALVKLAQNSSRVIAFDADARNATYVQKIKEFDDSRYVDCLLAEQNLISVAIGAMCRTELIAFVSTFSAFLTRAFDQIRMGAMSETHINICGSHSGVSVGEEGPSHMGLEDIAMFRSVPGCTIFYPSDAVATEVAVEMAANIKGMVYIRTQRPKTPVIYPNDKLFRVGEAPIVVRHPNDQLLIISAGITLIEAIGAAKELNGSGIHIRVMDLFTIQPIDVNGIKTHARESKGMVITVEDHYAHGGIGEAVLSVLAEEPNVLVRKIAIQKTPRSGKATELLDYYGISKCNIVLAVKDFLGLQKENGAKAKKEVKPDLKNYSSHKQLLL